MKTMKAVESDEKHEDDFYVSISISLSNAMLEKRKGSVKSQDSGRSSSFRKAFEVLFFRLFRPFVMMFCLRPRQHFH